MKVYRIQPVGAALHGVRTETSNGELANGVHVFTSLGQVAACRHWLKQRRVELVEIECLQSDLSDNGDSEGDLLRRGRGKIVSRRRFADTTAVAVWVENQS